MAYEFLIIALGAFLLQGEVLCDGYPKETPGDKVALKEGSSSGSAKSGGETSKTLVATSTPALASYNSVLTSALNPAVLSGLYPGLYAAGYPPISTDYVSRYYGPTYIPTVLPDGHIADTAAVAAARAAHLGVLERAKALWYGLKDDGTYNPYKYGDYAYNYNNNYLNGGLYGPPNRPYYGPLASPTLLPSGYLADTPATAAARAAHLQALARARADAALWKAKAYGG
ncbi:uncharacterized protein LOC128983616 [Macrosteles quadrilineatus]|uniref:uncharacterized protein LOC128983616 n=1 Tax=Macrosteles quadrilineatus TaxID=74068 RepID=UPI0023E15DCC|nr:uncharacterized protein LOC128983616 [Macrosteles quadrilineatus]